LKTYPISCDWITQIFLRFQIAFKKKKKKNHKTYTFGLQNHTKRTLSGGFNTEINLVIKTQSRKLNRKIKTLNYVHHSNISHGIRIDINSIID